MSIKENITSLGIPKTYKCPQCGKTESLSTAERHNLADCIMSNGAGLWALKHCESCAYVGYVYPTKINGVDCTPEECEALQKEIERYERK